MTNSIENVVTGDSFTTDVSLVSREDLRLVTKRNGWAFDWKYELRQLQRGFEGNVSFIAKTRLIEHYEKTLGAFHFGGRVMIIETKAAIKLINRYFKNEES